MDFDFLVKQCELLISFDELGTEDVSLVDYHLVIFLLLQFLAFRLTDNVLQTTDVKVLSLNHIITGLYLLFDALDLLGQFRVLILVGL